MLYSGALQVLPWIWIKSFQNRIGILDIFLCFLAHIEYWTVLACAKNILKVILVSEYVPARKGIPDAKTLGSVDIASTVSRSALEAQTNGWLVFDKVLEVVACSCHRPLHLHRVVESFILTRVWVQTHLLPCCPSVGVFYTPYMSPFWPQTSSGHPHWALRFVWLSYARPTLQSWHEQIGRDARGKTDSRNEFAFSPRIGSKILMSGLESWLSR